MVDFSNRPPGQNEQGKLGDAGCTTGVEDTYGVGRSGLSTGMSERQGISGACGSDGKEGA